MLLDQPRIYCAIWKRPRFFHPLFRVRPTAVPQPKTSLRTYFLTFSEGARLEVMTRDGLPEGDPAAEKTGFTHLAFKLDGREAVDALTARLSADGFAVVGGPRVTGDGYYESCVLGPEGCRLVLTA
jgi:lactoylglutathione lyase